MVGDDLVDFFASGDLGGDAVGELERTPVALHLERSAGNLLPARRDLRLAVRGERGRPADRTGKDSRRNVKFSASISFLFLPGFGACRFLIGRSFHDEKIFSLRKLSTTSSMTSMPRPGPVGG
jgi:hypothetical protein